MCKIEHASVITSDALRGYCPQTSKYDILLESKSHDTTLEGYILSGNVRLMVLRTEPAPAACLEAAR